MGWVRKWWAQPDHYRWLSGYLGHRNVRVFTRYMMAAVVASLGAVPLLIMWTPFGPTGPIGQAISVLVIACCAAMATMWSTRWPSRRQSVVFVVVSNAGIAATCLLVYTTPGMSLLGCTAFAALAGYVAFFHTSRYLALVLTTATATSIACAVQLATSESVLVALAALLIIAVGVLAVPFSVHVLVHLLGDDALKSHTDPLTGLRNRRGFYRSVRELTRGSAHAEPYLSVIMIDLDGFKKVNDTRGHTSGDRVLVAVADRLRHTTRRRAVIARVGGEEFLIAEMTQCEEGQTIAERLRQEVAAIPWGATASVGVASISRDDIVDLDTRTVVDHLVDAADVAMYEAKRAGGNRTRRAESIEIHSR